MYIVWFGWKTERYEHLKAALPPSKASYGKNIFVKCIEGRTRTQFNHQVSLLSDNIRYHDIWFVAET